MSILKKLRRLCRRYKTLVFLGSFLLTATLVTNNGLMNMLTEGLNISTKKEETESINVLADQPIELVLQTKYLCGTETQTKEFQDVQALEEWTQEQEHEWELIKKNNGTHMFAREVRNDLSPLCKNEGYFGISEDKKLTIFQGPPTENQVIKTFFRIDTEKLESKLPKDEVIHLRKGIRIRNVAEYLSVLSTYGEFATEL